MHLYIDFSYGLIFYATTTILLYYYIVNHVYNPKLILLLIKNIYIELRNLGN